MAYILKKNGKTPNIPFKHFNCDEASDLSKIDLYLVPMGSTCRVISDGDTYILNSKKQWIKQPKGVINSDGEVPPGEDTPGDSPDNPNDDKHWDGGDIDFES